MDAMFLRVFFHGRRDIMDDDYLADVIERGIF